MLKRLLEVTDWSGAETTAAEASFPALFPSGLEFNAPARGHWNIVHLGMLLPQSHQVFVCAQGCLRGVVLTAAEMNAMDRMSWVAVTQNDLLGSGMQQQIVDGTAEILSRMDVLPPAVLVFISCIQQFAGCDMGDVCRELKNRFPATGFIDCYMNPTMRKSGLTPDQIMRRQLYALLEPAPKQPRSVNFLGAEYSVSERSELMRLLRGEKFTVRDITNCKSFSEYRQMEESAVNITVLPNARAAGDELARRLGQKHLYLPLCYGREEILRNLRLAADCFGAAVPDTSGPEEDADEALRRACGKVGSLPLEISFTATPRPLGLARLLLEHGFAVRRVYLDTVNPEEEADFLWLKRRAPELLFTSTLRPQMRFRAERSEEPVLAIGQEAAYFADTRHFVNLNAGGGLYGFSGISELAGLIEDAAAREKDLDFVIAKKALGCESCL